MAIFTDTPIVIRATSPWFWLHDYGGVSEFSYGGARYVCGASQDLSTPIVAKSTDGGATWTVFINSESGFAFDFLEMILDVTTNAIIFIGVHTSQLATFRFDLTLESFTPAVLLSAGTPGGQYIARRPSGEVLAVYTHGASPRSIRLVSTTGLAFGSPVLLLSDALNLTVRGVQSDASGNLFIFFGKGGDTWFVRVDASNVVGTPILVDNTQSTLLSNIVVDEGLDQVMAMSVFNNLNYIYVGTGLSSPTFATHDLHSFFDDAQDNEGCLALDAGVVKCFFMHQNFADINQVGLVEWNGSTVGAYQVWWDLLANRTPGTETVPQDDIFTDGITALSAGGLLSVVVTAVIDTALEMSNVYTYGASGPAERLRGRFY